MFFFCLSFSRRMIQNRGMLEGTRLGKRNSVKSFLSNTDTMLDEINIERVDEKILRALLVRRESEMLPSVKQKIYYVYDFTTLFKIRNRYSNSYWYVLRRFNNCNILYDKNCFVNKISIAYVITFTY